MVLYNDNLLLFGGFSKSSMNPIHQTSTFFNELHLYDSKKNCWEEVFKNFYFFYQRVLDYDIFFRLFLKILLHI